jgi:VCBS repeat-containing protein
MPNVIMEIEPQADSTPDVYVEGADGFAITAGQPYSETGQQTHDGLTLETEGAETYLRSTFSNSTVFLESTTTGKTFGLLEIDLDGFVNHAGSGGIRSDSAEVIFTFTAIKPSEVFPVTFTFTTNQLSDFELLSVDATDPRFRLPEAFRGGIVQLSWTVTGDVSVPNIWGAFDRLVLSTNSAPSVEDVTLPGAVAPVDPNDPDSAVAPITGRLEAFDQDGDTLTYQLVGDAPAGFTLNSDGTFTYLPNSSDQSLDGDETRTYTFGFRASDGETDSATATGTLEIHGYVSPFGQSLIGNNKPNPMTGGAGSDTLAGMQNNDTLIGGWGDDLLIGQNDKDLLLGGGGADRLFGDNGSDTLNGGRGSDTLFGGAGPDTFVFDRTSGDDVIGDFDVKNDVMKFTGVYTSYTQAMANASQTSAGVVFTYTGDDDLAHTITLSGMLKSQLKADDFIFG